MHVRRSLAAVIAAGSLLLAAGCAGDDLAKGGSGGGSSKEPSGSGDKGTVHLASQNFPEAAIVTSMYDQLLTKAGYTTDVKLVDARDAYMGAFPKSIDVVPEYVGGIVNFLNTAKNGDNAKPFDQGDGKALAEAGKPLLDAAGITLLDQSSATDTNAFFVTKEFAQSQGNATKLSDLKGLQLVLAAAPDCKGRLDCEGGLTDKYGIDITEVLPLGYAVDATYKSVLDNESQLGETSTTDGTLDSQGLMVLEDDQHIQPAQNLVPAVSDTFLQAHPDIEPLLDKLMASLTTEKLTELNGKVSLDRQQPEDVAKDYLTSAGML